MLREGSFPVVPDFERVFGLGTKSNVLSSVLSLKGTSLAEVLDFCKPFSLGVFVCLFSFKCEIFRVVLDFDKSGVSTGVCIVFKSIFALHFERVLFDCINTGSLINGCGGILFSILKFSLDSKTLTVEVEDNVNFLLLTVRDLDFD